MRWTVIACIGIVAFGAFSALADRTIGYDYEGILGLVVSTAIYALPAVMVARDGHRLRAAAFAGGAVAAVDATIGWAIAWAIGPGAPPAGSGPEVLLLTVISVVGIGALVGLAAGFVTRRVTGRGAHPGNRVAREAHSSAPRRARRGRWPSGAVPA